MGSRKATACGGLFCLPNINQGEYMNERPLSEDPRWQAMSTGKKILTVIGGLLIATAVAVIGTIIYFGVMSLSGSDN